jgi:DNA-binding NtrC family response regulator
VLVVDDEPLIQWSVCTTLASAGFDPVPARTADEARRIAAEWPPPKVVLLDIRPDGEGRELMTEIRQICPDCRFLVMSTVRRAGVTWPQTRGVQCVEKPFDLAELVRLVDAASHEGPLRCA